MGHEINYFSFNYDTSRKSIEKEMNDYACRHGDAGGLYYPISFKEMTPFKSYDDAQKYIESIDKDYGQFAVPYLDYPYIKVTNDKLKEMETKLNELHREYYGRRDRQFYTTETIKSQYLGCKECGSRLAVKYLHGNRCPLCGAEMRPETELNKIKALKEKYDKAFNAFVSARDKEEEKAKQKLSCTKKWLVKIEYHC